MFEIVNNVTFILLSVSVILFPLWAICFYCKKFKKWQDKDFEEKYGAALEGLKKDSRTALGYPIIFMLRRFALVITVTLGTNYLFL
mmetsp:Transcript_6846/g.9417  ORF Transcript_6846/g.9417 Transcript_6846/m.9417 type:complete len:86 (-) Transcript_6846:1131-1388(-)